MKERIEESPELTLEVVHLVVVVVLVSVAVRMRATENGLE